MDKKTHLEYYNARYTALQHIAETLVEQTSNDTIIEDIMEDFETYQMPESPQQFIDKSEPLWTATLTTIVQKRQTDIDEQEETD